MSLEKDNDQRVAESWATMIEANSASVRHKDIYPMLKEWLVSADATKVLEVGCGQGICSDQIDLNGAEYRGIDPSSFLIKRARSLYPADNKKFIKGRASALPVASDDFDAAYLISVLHLLGDLKSSMYELSRALKDGGHFLIITANPASYSSWKALYTETKIDGQRLDGKFKSQDGSDLWETLYLHSYDQIVKSLYSCDLIVRKEVVFRKPEDSEHGIYLALSGQKLSQS